MRDQGYGKRNNFSYEHPREEPAKLAPKAQNVLRRNDMGGWTKAAPELYPHQWSWDSAFIAIGLARLDTRRAARELETLFAHQWKTGKVPHIVFNQDAPPESYFPDSILSRGLSVLRAGDALIVVSPYLSCAIVVDYRAGVTGINVRIHAGHEGGWT